METNYTNIKHFKFNSVNNSTITTVGDSDLISFEIMEEQYNGIELTMDKKYSDIIEKVKQLSYEDVFGLDEAEKSYGDRWKQRGGVGAFMMLARKWDRLEKQVEQQNYDVFKAAELDMRDEGILDDIRDLRRYLFLVEAEIRMRNEK